MRLAAILLPNHIHKAVQESHFGVIKFTYSLDVIGNWLAAEYIHSVNRLINAANVRLEYIMCFTNQIVTKYNCITKNK